MRRPSAETVARPDSMNLPMLSLPGVCSKRKSVPCEPGSRPSGFGKVSLPPGFSVTLKGEICAIAVLKKPPGRSTGVRLLSSCVRKMLPPSVPSGKVAVPVGTSSVMLPVVIEPALLNLPELPSFTEIETECGALPPLAEPTGRPGPVACCSEIGRAT